MLLKVLCSTASIGSVVTIFSVQRLQAKDMVVCHDCHMKRLPKARELPLYDKNENLILEKNEASELPLASGISTVRQQIVKYGSYLDVAMKEALHVYETGIAHSKSTFDYLKDEENKIAQYLIIASGGLFGYLYARKGGIFKKIFMFSAGTGAVFTVFYPQVTKTYASAGYDFSKQKIDFMLSNYGGYDTSKMAEETNEKLQYIKSVMKYEGLMNKLKEAFYKNQTSGSEKAVSENKESKTDQDLYTTRTPV